MRKQKPWASISFRETWKDWCSTLTTSAFSMNWRMEVNFSTVRERGEKIIWP